MKSISQLLNKILINTTDELYVQNPCKVVGVNGNYVDVLLYINDEEPDQVIYNVPVIRPAETQRAYVFLGIKEGDRGICRFFDRSTEAYLKSDFDYNSDDRQHDINDRCFELGFLPDEEAFVYPTDQEIEIGLKNVKFRLSVDNDGNVDILSEGDVNLKITGNVTSEIDGNVTSLVKGSVVSTINGNSTSTISGTSTIICPTTNHTGNINIEGQVVVNGEVISNGVALSTHTHKGVTAGNSSTGQPNK